jgi:hypothetical protein
MARLRMLSPDLRRLDGVDMTTPGPRGLSDASARVDDDATVELKFPGRPEYLRLARLAAADTGARAGLSVDDLENLRIAVDEMTYAIMGERGSGEVNLRYRASQGVVMIEGSCAAGPSDRPLELSELARSIVSAVVDEHTIGTDNGSWHFRLVKRGRA